MQGREVYLKRCWMCHGDAGQGDGPSAQNLVPPPANFTVDEFDDDARLRAVLEGHRGHRQHGDATVGLLLSEQDRWDAIHYVKRTFISPSEPDDVSDELPVRYQALTCAVADTPERARTAGSSTRRSARGCHGPKALGDGAYGPPLMPTPANLTEDPALTSPPTGGTGGVDQGVVGSTAARENLHPTAMPAWRFILTDEQKWEIVYYSRELVGAKDPEVAN